jgi:DNA polymerase-4
MRRPETIEHLYLDFDGFFASVEQLRDPRLRGRPVGVIPYVGGRTCIIACSREAKARGVQNIMMVDEALAKCRDLVLVPQKPDLYRRAHNALVSVIGSVIPIDQIKSIDELSCLLDAAARRAPSDTAHNIKQAIRYEIGATVTCSIGFAANRHLAKIAGGTQKPDGLSIWRPDEAEKQLHKLKLDDIPGIGKSMHKRLLRMGIYDVKTLMGLQPKHVRAIWKNVTGERLWYTLHGYDVQAPETQRNMFGHARVLPPDQRSLTDAREIARLLLIKAARRTRRDHFYATNLYLWLRGFERGWGDILALPQVNDDQAVLAGLTILWDRVIPLLPPRTQILRVGVTLGDLVPASARQLDLFLSDDVERQKAERIGAAMDGLNSKFGRTVVSVGPWEPPGGGNVGGKISFTRIPSAEDFW